MIIGRLRQLERGWATLDPVIGEARAIRGHFADWATEAARGSIDEALLGPPIAFVLADLLAPLEPGARIFAAGRNYGEHLLRLGADIPNSPTVFIMPDSAIVGPGIDIAYPAITEELDYEVELVAVLAAPLGVGEPATRSLLGYTIGNDVSARDAAKRAGGRSDLFSQKSSDRSTPLGPWIVTADALGGTAQPRLEIGLSVNGELRQRDTTASMLFPVASCLDYVDDRVALRAGDVVFTGSTHGVGLETGRFLHPGDLVEATIEGIGALRNHVGAQSRGLRFSGGERES